MEDGAIKVVAESSPAPTAPPDGTQILGSMTPEQRADWRSTGKLPEKDTKQDSSKTKESTPSDAAKVADAPKVEDPEASSTEKKSEKKVESGTTDESAQDASSDKQYGEEARKRINQLTAEKKSEREQREAAQRRIADLEAAAAKAAAPAKDEKKEAKDDYVPLNEAEWLKNNPEGKYEDWVRAEARHVAAWEYDQREKAKEATAKKAQQDKIDAEFRETWKTRAAKSIEKHEDWSAVAADPNLPIPVGSVIDAVIADSEIGPEMLYHLGKNRDVLSKIAAMSPVKQVRELFKLEDTLSKGFASTTAKEEGSEAEADAAPVKQVSEAPPPAGEVSGRKTPSQNPAGDAAKKGDFRSFKAQRDAEERAKLRKA